MWQTFAAKYMNYSPFIEINGRAGSWRFEKDVHSDDLILSLNSTDTRAMVQWSGSFFFPCLWERHSENLNRWGGTSISNWWVSSIGNLLTSKVGY